MEDEANHLVGDEIKWLFHAELKSITEKTKNMWHLMVMSWRCLQKHPNEFKLLTPAFLQLWATYPTEVAFSHKKPTQRISIFTSGGFWCSPMQGHCTVPPVSFHLRMDSPWRTCNTLPAMSQRVGACPRIPKDSWALV